MAGFLSLHLLLCFSFLLGLLGIGKKVTDHIDGKRKNDDGILLHSKLRQSRQVAKLHGQRFLSHRLGGIQKFLGSLKFSIGMNDFGGFIALSLAFWTHDAMVDLHA